MPMNLRRYPRNWQRVARELKEAVGYICQECNAQCRRTRAGDGPICTVAHVWPDDHAPDAEVVCVQLLCLHCHLRFDAQHTATRVRRWHRRHNMTLVRLHMPLATIEDVAELEAAWPGHEYLASLPDGVDRFREQYGEPTGGTL